MKWIAVVVVIAGCGGDTEPPGNEDDRCGMCTNGDGSQTRCCADPGGDRLYACTWNTGVRVNPNRVPAGEHCPPGEAEEVCIDLSDGTPFDGGCEDPHAFECYANHGTTNPSCCYDPELTGWDGESFHKNTPASCDGRGCGQADCY